MVVFYKRTTNDYCDEIEKILPLSRLLVCSFFLFARFNLAEKRFFLPSGYQPVSSWLLRRMVSDSL